MAKKMKKTPDEFRVFSSQPHQNYNASIYFGAIVRGAVDEVRQGVALMSQRSITDEYALGAIRALRKLCEGEKEKFLCIYKLEVIEWQATVQTWFERVKDEIPQGIRQKLLEEINEDLRILLSCAGGPTVLFSRSEANSRYIRLTFESDEALEQAKKLADRKHPVQLGSALHEYLYKCIQELVDHI